jgi:hypothetical protein
MADLEAELGVGLVEREGLLLGPRGGGESEEGERHEGREAAESDHERKFSFFSCRFGASPEKAKV